ncbi:hypothetical protein [Microbacterium candidum]|uniref:DUF2214 domain-containing protein n=1 Tax=Microbacterium candidum TaxID=3041922 RepID=A0ABT7MTI0_9MICO|nr:hypothetical protein [Microbacterium sp. ASV49]MDL9977759.1 hypothetical protein [Microbacterium sp. ASV49]
MSAPTIPLSERRRVWRHRRALAYWGVLFAWTFSVAGSVAIHPLPQIRLIALFVHLASVVVGLGAAVMVEYNGLLWMLGRRRIGAVNEAEHTLSFVVWMGIAGLLASGLFLHPDLGNPLTDLKLAAVLVLSMNGVAVTRLAHELQRLPDDMPFRRTPRALRWWATESGIVSQLAWWTAVIIGMLNTAAR